MKTIRIYFLGIIVLGVTSISCNLSSNFLQEATATLAPTNTPENTATITLPPTFPAPMELPTKTPIPPTETLIPTETATITPELPTETSTSTLLPYDPNSSPTPPPTIPSGYIAPKTSYAYTATSIAAFVTPKPLMRGVTSLYAVHFSPNIDGDWNDWPNAEAAAGYVVFGSDKWVNANDLSSSVKAAYDGNYLYISAMVVDDVYSQMSSGHDMYLGDDLEILIDTDLAGDYSSKTLSSDDYQLGINPGRDRIDGEKDAWLWYPDSMKGSRSQVIIASQAIEGGYMVEAAIPWSVFGISPASGQHYGFAFSVSDNDTPGVIRQESMVSNVSTRKLLNPVTWGDLTLQ